MPTTGSPVEEALQALYVLTTEERRRELALNDPVWDALEPGVAQTLVERGLAMIEGNSVRLTAAGEEQALLVVRRHRLAERLLTDVLDFQLGADDDIACELEHIVSPELTRSICTLLGHPTECPRGRPIPPGSCCEAREREVEAAIMSLTDLKAGERGVIAFMGGRQPQHRGGHVAGGHGPRHHGHGGRGAPRADGHLQRRLGRLTSLGIFPGEKVRVRQTKPALIIESDRTVIALDAEVAAGIRVRKVQPD